ncbi:cytochrome [Roseovarius sp. TE539]|uniref:cytochrome b/b6 domain-containing protein n=1 Tax=Roseovarius sp. TE539 TaxID=2249812 RepID=UPI000DDDF614|nr:cytochrome b/b6 domain-containing protein [Roseovarius sp. TE539]RBI74506.1 cytochrome [Roseovarius sp. TE539]
MPLTNTPKAYGAVTKTFHWLTAILIFTAVPLGFFANDLAHQVRDPAISTTDATVARAALLFSLHKTVGVTIFFVALARIIWTLAQPKPALLNGDRPAEARLAETVHWLLYGSLVAVPMSGWIHHASTTGFAPIWWPFGQTLPFVPRDATVAEISATVHYVLQWVLIGSVGLHVAGALKHHVLDGDATLRRMLPGHHPAEPTRDQPGHALPIIAALAVWTAALGGAASLGWFAQDGSAPGTAALQQVESDWQVETGSLEITVTQMGSEITGSFADWTADITYSRQPDPDGKHGSVDVTIAIGSLSLGSVTDQAMGKDFFNAEEYPTAQFEADILNAGEGKIARGTLTIRGQTVPVEMPFTLTIDGQTADARGGLTVDRRSFQIGEGVSDPGSLAFEVVIAFDLTATRSEK